MHYLASQRLGHHCLHEHLEQMRLSSQIQVAQLAEVQWTELCWLGSGSGFATLLLRDLEVADILPMHFS